MKKILIVEDDLMLGQALLDCLKRRGFSAEWARDGKSASIKLSQTNWKLIILDIGLPEQTGTDLLYQLRRANDQTPVLMLTARDGVNEKIKHFNLGADDYMVKPFDVDELVARMHVLIRRFYTAHDSLLKYNDIVLNFDNHQVLWKNKDVKLHKMEFSILSELLLNKGKVVSREKLEQTYELGKNVKSNAIEVHVHHIRTKLYPSLIKTIRGIGYIVEKES